MPELYRLSWEMVPVGNRRLQLIADGVPAERVPDEDWHSVERVGVAETGVLTQAATLADWQATGQPYVRRVRLERQVQQPVWEEVPLP